MRTAKRLSGVLLLLALLMHPGVALADGWVEPVAVFPESEVLLNLRKLADSSVAYFQQERSDRNGTPLPRSFPTSAARTPLTRPACQGGRPIRTWPTGKEFASETWQKLNFSVDDPFYFQYEYTSSGTGSKARFTARAVIDWDCNGIEAVFERTGYVDGAGNVRLSPLRMPKPGVQ